MEKCNKLRQTFFTVCCCTTRKQFMKRSSQPLKFRNDSTSVCFCQNENLCFIRDINGLWYQKKHPIHKESKIFYAVKYRLCIEASVWEITCNTKCKRRGPANWHYQGSTALGNMSKYLLSWWEIIANSCLKKSHLIGKVK